MEKALTGRTPWPVFRDKPESGLFRRPFAGRLTFGQPHEKSPHGPDTMARVSGQARKRSFSPSICGASDLRSAAWKDAVFGFAAKPACKYICQTGTAVRRLACEDFFRSAACRRQATYFFKREKVGKKRFFRLCARGKRNSRQAISTPWLSRSKTSRLAGLMLFRPAAVRYLWDILSGNYLPQ